MCANFILYHCMLYIGHIVDYADCKPLVCTDFYFKKEKFHATFIKYFFAISREYGGESKEKLVFSDE